MSPTTLLHLGFCPLVSAKGRFAFLKETYGGHYRVLFPDTSTGWATDIEQVGEPGEGALFVRLGNAPFTYTSSTVFRRSIGQRYYIPRAQTEWFWDNFVRVEA